MYITRNSISIVNLYLYCFSYLSIQCKATIDKDQTVESKTTKYPIKIKSKVMSQNTRIENGVDLIVAAQFKIVYEISTLSVKLFNHVQLDLRSS